MAPRVFLLLLRLFPRAFREAFGDEMRSVLADQYRAARETGVAATAAFWWRTITGMTAAAWRERQAGRAGEVGLPWHETLLTDVRLTGRLLSRAPLFTALVVTAVAVGVGGVATVFSALNAIVLRPLPGTTDGDRLILVDRRTPDSSEGVSASYGFYRYLAGSTQSLDGAAAWSRVALTISRGGPAHSVAGTIVSGNYFTVLGLRPEAGRFFLPEEDAIPLAHPVIVVSHDFWTSQLNANPAAIGRELTVNGRPYRLIGVAPPGFHGVFTPLKLDAWVPLAMQPHVRAGRDLERAPWLFVFGRMRAGVTPTMARAELSTLTERWAASSGDFPRYTAMRVTPLTGLPDDARRALLGFGAVLLGASTLVLVIAGANVSSLLASRAAARRREIGVRVALGASRGRLVRQLLTETLALFLLAGAGGCALAAAATGALERLPLPGDAALTLEISPDWRVLLFSIGVSLLAGAIFGAGPALRGVGRNPGALLRADSAGAGRRTFVSGALVVAQMACSLVLLTAAALFIRSVTEGAALDPRFESGGVAVAPFNTEAYGYDPARGRRFYDTLRRRLESSPAVERVAFGNMVPLTFADSGTVVTVDRAADGSALRLPVRTANVTAGYLDTLRIPLVAGRDFAAGDTAAADTAIVNETLARRAWGDTNAIGRTLHAHGRSTTVIGVARDSRYGSLTEGAVAFLYLPMPAGETVRTIVVRSRTGGPPQASLIESEVLAIDAQLPRPAVRALRTEIAGVLFPQRVAALVTGILGAAGLLLAAIGLYGLVSYGVRLRLRELGVRIALGADARSVIWLVVSRELRLGALGVALGLVGAVLAGRLFAAYLVRVSPLDPRAFVAAAAILVFTAALAAYLPARRAAQADPLTILRTE
ncbi:MAG TPA: ADOP family duplicated permease [Vicinamibacterales bacterium]|nr:ADOP family duplicated permease [Vicinamibacterales bacterium]